MGGSGGFSGYGSISAKAQMLASETGTQSSQREIEINEFLEALLKDFNSRDADAIQTHLKEILNKVLPIVNSDGALKLDLSQVIAVLKQEIILSAILISKMSCKLECK